MHIYLNNDLYINIPLLKGNLIMHERTQRMEQKLKQALEPSTCTLEDLSYQHSSHNKDSEQGGTHYNLVIVSKKFEGLTLVERHRLVQKVIQDEFETGLHAFNITARISE